MNPHANIWLVTNLNDWLPNLLKFHTPTSGSGVCRIQWCCHNVG